MVAEQHTCWRYARSSDSCLVGFLCKAARGSRLYGARTPLRGKVWCVRKRFKGASQASDLGVEAES